MKKFIEEFRAFIAKGNAIDMAVAIVVGGAFSKIVSSLVEDIIMPLIGLIVGGTNISSLKWVIREAVINEAGEVIKAETALTYGVFIQAVIDFLLISFCIFVFLKIMLLAKERFLKAKEVPKETTDEVENASESTDDLLRDIRDILKDSRSAD